MFDFLNGWKNFWQSGTATEKMPQTEKDRGQRVSYPYPMKKVSIDNNVDIAYVDEGDEKEAVLIFIHGMGSGIPAWEKNIRELRKDFRCIALDLPGHGYSTKGDFPFTINFYADVVLSFIQKLQLSTVALVGHSMGGQTAIIAGLKAPAIIERLILVSPAGVEPYTVMEKQTLIHMTAGVVASGNAYTKNRMNYLIGFCENQQEAGELAAKMAFYKDEAVDFGKMMQRSVEGMLLESVNHVLDKITQPCLVVVGKEDRVSPYPYIRGQKYVDVLALEASKIRNAKLVIFSSCGHFAQYQQPKLFNEALLDFVKAKEVV